MTYSIVARDPETGELGVAVQSHAPAVGSLCPFAEADVGAVATQSIVDPSYGPRGLGAMRDGEAAADGLARLTAEDDGRDVRQVAFVDAEGRVSAFTGERCIADAGHIIGDGFSCQANMMRSPGVPEAMAGAFTAATGDLAHRLLAALDAAQAAGGDIRGMQSAAIVVAGGTHTNWRIDDHPKPLIELRRLVDLPTVESPERWFWQGIGHAHAGELDDARAALAHAYADDDAWRELLRRLPASGLLPGELVERLV